MTTSLVFGRAGVPLPEPEAMLDLELLFPQLPDVTQLPQLHQQLTTPCCSLLSSAACIVLLKISGMTDIHGIFNNNVELKLRLDDLGSLRC